MSTKIEWCNETINPIVGCSKISTGCANCYAEKMARRLAAMGRGQYIRTTDGEGLWNGESTFVPSEMEKPTRWKKPRRIFIGSMGDIFHETIWRCWLDEVLQMVFNNPRHTFIMLTKRPQRMKEYFELSTPPWGMPSNLWLGVTVEDQQAADARIPVLLSIPAAVRFVSIEPLLGPVDLNRIYESGETPEGGTWGSWESCLDGKRFDVWSDGEIEGMPKLSWVITGPENGQGKRPYQLEWFYSLRGQCRDACVPFFLKGIDLEGVQVKEFPA